MKKLVLLLLCVTVSMIFIACQKSHDLPPPQSIGETMGNATGTTTNEVGMQSASECGQFRTQTQGGWGATPSGNNPGVYLHANFNTVFPAGLSVGCGTYSVSYSSADAVTEFLPAGGSAGILIASAVNPPGKSIKNVLIGQVTALALSVGFDYYDPNFAPAAENLGNLQIATGPFAGMSVVAFLDLANLQLGGCYTGYSFTELNETASMINENFVDGTTDGGFLTCPTVRFTER